LARPTAAGKIAGNEQINLLQLVHIAAFAIKAACPPNPPSSVYEQLVEHVEVPTFLADEYGLLKRNARAKTTRVVL
jgi:hypothetical protein